MYHRKSRSESAWVAKRCYGYPLRITLFLYTSVYFRSLQFGLICNLTLTETSFEIYTHVKTHTFKNPQTICFDFILGSSLNFGVNIQPSPPHPIIRTLAKNLSGLNCVFFDRERKVVLNYYQSRLCSFVPSERPNFHKCVVDPRARNYMLLSRNMNESLFSLNISTAS